MTTNLILSGMIIGFVSVLAIVVAYAKHKFRCSWREAVELMARIFQ